MYARTIRWAQIPSQQTTNHYCRTKVSYQRVLHKTLLIKEKTASKTKLSYVVLNDVKANHVKLWLTYMYWGPSFGKAQPNCRHGIPCKHINLSIPALYCMIQDKQCQLLVYWWSYIFWFCFRFLYLTRNRSDLAEEALRSLRGPNADLEEEITSMKQEMNANPGKAISMI